MRFDYTTKALFHPERFQPFQAADAGPLSDGTCADMTPAKAWHFSSLAHCAYLDRGLLSEVLHTVDLELVTMFDRVGTQGFVARGANYAVLSFRGTEPDEPADLKRDLDVIPKPFLLGGRVHGGFLEALHGDNGVWKEVEEALGGLGSLSVWFTGHSLGAALATVAAATRKPTGLITFGSPRVGDEAFVQLLKDVRTYRYVNGADLVARIPPKIMYRHAGAMVFLDERRVSRVNPSRGYVWKRCAMLIARYALRFPLLRKGDVKLRSLVDHAIVNYSTALDNEIAK